MNWPTAIGLNIVAFAAIYAGDIHIETARPRMTSLVSVNGGKPQRLPQIDAMRLGPGQTTCEIDFASSPIDFGTEFEFECAGQTITIQSIKTLMSIEDTPNAPPAWNQPGLTMNPYGAGAIVTCSVGCYAMQLSGDAQPYIETISDGFPAWVQANEDVNLDCDSQYNVVATPFVIDEDGGDRIHDGFFVRGSRYSANWVFVVPEVQ